MPDSTGKARALSAGSFFVLSLFFFAAAAPLSSEELLTWERAVEAASLNNPDLKAAQESLESARAGHKAQFADFLPQISADAGLNRAGGDVAVSEDSSLGVSARQNLFSGGRDRADVERSRAELQAVEAELQDAKARISADLKRGFARQLYAQEQMSLAETIARRRQENVRLVGLRYEAGRENKGSFLRSRAALRQAEFEVSQAKRGLRVSQRELSAVLGSEPFRVIYTTGSFTVSPAEAVLDFETLARQTPAYRRSAAQAAGARAGVSIARSGYFPNLAASAGASRRGNSWPPESDRWSAGLSFSLPLFSGGNVYHSVRGARARERHAQADLKSAAHQAVLDLEQTFAGFQDAAERTVVQRDFLTAAEVRAEIARSQYTSGLLSFEDWDQIENDLINNQKAWLASLRDAVLSEAAWELAQGRGAIP
jgi:outer membrane protein TolC